MVTSLAKRDGCVLVCRDESRGRVEGGFSLLSRDASAGGNGRQAGLAGCSSCSSMAHGGGRLASLLGDAAAVSADACVVGI